ncbi:pilus assembly protein TadG-related protein [Cryobacterium fucosi]|uniref:Putative Flp pilus-assembly TadG-like N-terminal domain-containing protein n=1 Tax=Cryobacterium fucosi TaxID=1259157 RepID=A0A4R9B7L9_9MICO|nr:pilus assembly protein TadG-related protein [Cryobacterium fucosi]TFD77694.1 hypothetical protein E3T48_08490 [Cryobacterium fucosi]
MISRPAVGRCGHRFAAIRRVRGRTGSDEEGSTLILTIFYAFLALVLILVVVAASSLYLERKRLLTLADGAALAGAESFSLDAVGVTDLASGPVPRPALRSEEVRVAAEAYLATAPHGGVAGVELTGAGSTDGQSATVALGAVWRPPVLAFFLPEGVPLEVTAVARSVFR